MSEKISILKVLDFEKLDKKIGEYRLENHEDPYLFVNNNTFDEIYKELSGEPRNEKKLTNGLFGCFKGVKFYQNDDLEFGEVELR